jgi:hypothetical protein
MNTSPRPGVFELKDIGINKQIITAIKKRTRAALQQTIKGEKKLKKNGTYKLFSPKSMKQMSKTRKEKQIIQPHNPKEPIKKCPQAIIKNISSSKCYKPKEVNIACLSQRSIGISVCSSNKTHNSR